VVLSRGSTVELLPHQGGGGVAGFHNSQVGDMPGGKRGGVDRIDTSQTPQNDVCATRDILVGAGSTTKGLRIHIIDSKGNTVPEKRPPTKSGSAEPQQNIPPGAHETKGRPGRTFTIVSFPLKPGQSVGENSEIDLSKDWDLSKPGVYTIQAERWDSSSKGFVKSNTITVTVMP
jgi:hypothetical protein